MYIALLMMLAGILVGRVFRRVLAGAWLGRAVFLGVLALLFLLGIEIGVNDRLFAYLPAFGWRALVISLAVMAGSLLCARLLQTWLAKRGYFKE